MSTSTSKPSAVSKAAVLKNLGAETDEEKVHVKEETVTTKVYTQDKDEIKTKGKQTESQSINENVSFDRQSLPFNIENKGAPQDRLAQMFADMKDAEDEENEIFVALITRLPDLMTDNFRNPCMQAMSFAPMQITSNMLLSFIPLLQKHNGNSGGRFKIVICDINGEPLDIGISGLLISNPIIEEKAASEANSSTDLLAVIDRITQQSDARFAELLRVVKDSNKEDEFTQLVKEKMRNDFLNPPQPKTSEFNPDATIERVMTSMAVTEAMAKGFAKMFDRNEPAEKEQGLLASLLSNEMFVDRASHLLENVTNNLAVIANNVATQRPAQPPPVYNPDTGNDRYPPLPPNPTPQPPPAQTSNDMTIEEQEKLIKTIIEELESDRPINSDNVFLNELKEKHATQYQGLSVACKVMQFDVLLAQLEENFPDTFADFYEESDEKDDNGDAVVDFNERGKKLEIRLKEFYEYMKAAA